MLPTYHVSGAVPGPGGHRPETGDKPPTSSPACGQTAVSEAGGQVCGALKADHPRRKQGDEQDKRTEVPTSLVCPGGVSPLDTAGPGGGDSARGQQWGSAVGWGRHRSVYRTPGPSGSGGGGRGLRGGKRKSDGSAGSNALSVGPHHLRGGEGGRGLNRPPVDLFFFRHKWASQLTDTHY